MTPRRKRKSTAKPAAPAAAPALPSPAPSSKERVRAWAWDCDVQSYLAGRAEIDQANMLAIELEEYWGCGRLRLLVDTHLREKFDRQRVLFNAAICSGSLDHVRREAQRMCVAWRTLDVWAKDHSCRPLPPAVWEVTLEDGSVAAIVPDAARVSCVIKDADRAIAIFTLDEIAQLLTHYHDIVRAKLSVSGATVVQVKKSIADPLDLVPADASLETKLEDPVPNWGLDMGIKKAGDVG